MGYGLQNNYFDTNKADRLFEVAEKGNEQEVRALLNEGAGDYLSSSFSGEKPLSGYQIGYQIAGKQGHDKVQKAILGHFFITMVEPKADPNGFVCVNFCLHPFDYAVTNQKIELLQPLKDLGVNINERNAHGNTPLYDTIEINNEKCIVQFIQSENAHDYTPLCASIMSKSEECTLKLIELGADLNASSEERLGPFHPGIYQTTPIAFAIRAGNLPLTLQLLDLGVDILTPCVQGTNTITPLGLAKNRMNQSIIDALERRIAIAL